MNEIKIDRQNGGITPSLPGEDHISGFLAYIPTADIPTAFKTNPIQAISSLEKAEELGITNQGTWEMKALHYHLSEIVRLNPAISLYVGIFPTPEANQSFSEIKEMQNHTSGKLRQIGVYSPSTELTTSDVTTLQGIATTLEVEDAPLSIIYAAKVTNLTALTDLSGQNQKNVSVVISQDGTGVAAELFAAAENADKKSVSSLGNALGMLSIAAVNESIGWVKKFPSGIALAAFSDGTLLRALDKAVIEDLDSKHFVFLTTYAGISGCYYNDSHTMDAKTSDYATIERVRTMDKAVRGIRTYLLPKLGAPIYVDPNTGKLRPIDVANLEMIAGKALEDMELAAELSGYKVEVDPNQNVLATSKIEFIIKQVPVGVMRKVSVKIGFTTKN